MICDYEPITNTITIQYNYRPHPNEDEVTKVCTASVLSLKKICYDEFYSGQKNYCSCIPLGAMNLRNLISCSQDIIPIDTVRSPFLRGTDLLTHYFLLDTSATIYNPKTEQHEMIYDRKYWHISWRIPYSAGDCQVQHSIIKQSLKAVNFHTVRCNTLLNFHILYERKER